MSEETYIRKCVLPSRGYLYDGLLPGGICAMRPMKTREEKMITAAKNDNFSIIDEICKRCLVDFPIEWGDVLVGDKGYMFIHLRSITYGNIYRFELRCPSTTCRHKFDMELTLPEGLEVTMLEETDAGVWTLDMPFAQTTITVDRMRNKDEDTVRNYVRMHKKRNQKEIGDEAYIYRLATFIKKIGDKEVEIGEAINFVEDMYGGDSVILRRSIEDNDCGVRFILEYTCPMCGEDFQRMLPMTAEFFRPESSDISAWRANETASVSSDDRENTSE